MTFGLGKSAADERALAASRGRCVMIIEEAIVSGRSGSWSAESGIALLLSAGVLGLDPEFDGTGDVGGCILQWWL